MTIMLHKFTGITAFIITFICCSANLKSNSVNHPNLFSSISNITKQKNKTSYPDSIKIKDVTFSKDTTISASKSISITGEITTIKDAKVIIKSGDEIVIDQSSTLEGDIVLEIDSSLYTPNITEISLSNNLEELLTISPNPATNNVLINMTNVGSGTLNIYRANGDLVKTILLIKAATEISIIELPAGIYITEVISNHSIQRRKLVISR